MGCSSMTKVDETPKYNFKNEIRDEIVQMVFRNPFYNVHEPQKKYKSQI